MPISAISGSRTSPTRTTIVQRTPTTPLVRTTHRRTDAVSAWLIRSLLDSRLARGVAPESSRLLAVRAAQLVGARNRRSLADAWDGVVVRASQPRGAIGPRVPVARRAVHAAVPEIAALARALRGASPVAARDIARAAALLTDGAGPVYTGRPDLRSAVAGLVDDLTFAARIG